MLKTESRMNEEMMKRPKGIRVMAVLHLVLALSGIYRIVSDLAAMKEVRRLRMVGNVGSFTETFAETCAAYARAALMYHMVDILAAVVLAGLLIGAGVMLLRDRRLGRTLSITYAITSIALRVGMVVWYAVGVHPKHAAFLTVLHAESPSMALLMPIPSTAGWWVGMVLLSLYPLWVWWYLRKEEVRYYFEDS